MQEFALSNIFYGLKNKDLDIKKIAFFNDFCKLVRFVMSPVAKPGQIRIKPPVG